MAIVGSGQSIDTGEFRIANLAPGRYWLNATDRNRRMMMGEPPVRNTTGKPEEELITTYYHSSADEAGARPIELTAGQIPNEIDIRMKRSPVYRIRGRVEGPPPLRNSSATRIFLESNLDYYKEAASKSA